MTVEHESEAPAKVSIRRRKGILWLVLIVFLLLPPGWFAWKWERGRRQRLAAATLRNMGGTVLYEGEREGSEGPLLAGAEARSPSTLRNALGDDFFDPVVAVWLDQMEIVGADLVHLKAFPHLVELSCNGTDVGDDGLVYLTRLRQLEKLDLTLTRVTDDGLIRLQGLTRLKTLYLDGAEVTDQGLSRLRPLIQLEELRLMDTGVSDAGLVYLEELKNLKLLSLEGTAVTEAGVRRLQQALPGVRIIHPSQRR